jgi:hypothetical protein
LFIKNLFEREKFVLFSYKIKKFKKPKKPPKKKILVGFLGVFFLGFLGWVFLGGFFNANPAENPLLDLGSGN